MFDLPFDISKELERTDKFVSGLKRAAFDKKESVINVPDINKQGDIIPGKFTEYPLSEFLIKYHGRYKNTNVPNLLHDFQIRVTEKNKSGNNVEVPYYWEEFKKTHKNWRDFSRSNNPDRDGRGKNRYYIVQEYEKPDFLNDAQEEFIFQHKKRKEQEKEEEKHRKKISKETKKFAKDINARNSEREKLLKELSKEGRERENEAVREQRQSGKMGSYKMARSKKSPLRKRTPEDDEKTIEEAPRRARKKSQSPKKKSASPIEKRKKTGGRTAEDKSRRRAYSNWIKNQRRPYPPDKDKVYNSMEDSDFDKLKEAIDEKFFEDIHKEWGSDVRDKIIKFICEYTNGWNKKGREKYC
jgi:hypothetical protein